jgi:twitching motility protein PilI
MAKKGSLREFQAHLAERLVGASGQRAAGLLGIQSGADFWLLKLSDSGEVVPLTPLAEVPLTRSWFAGIANIRGNLYSAVDFAAFRGGEPTPQNAASRLLLIGTRYGSNAALLVTRLLGLRNIDDLVPAPADPGDLPWVAGAYTDNAGRCWKMLDVRRLLDDERFMEIGV